MAEGGNLKHTVTGSDAIYDYNCSDCLSRKSAYSEAVFYCPECHKYMCKQCVSCVHDVIGRGNMDQWGKPSKRAKFDPCPKHKGNAIQLYCPKHDVVCCSICGQTQHKTCGDLQYIPLIASVEANITDLTRVRKVLSELFAKADKLGKDRTTRLAGLDKMEQQLMTSVREYRAKIDAWLDDVEEQSIDDIRKLKVLFMDRFKFELAVCDTIKTEMTDLQKNLDLAVKDESLLFSRIKQGQEQVRDKSYLISDVARSETTDKAEFVPHTKLEELVQGLQGLGKLLTDTPVNKTQTPGLVKVKRAGGQGLDSKPNSVKLNQPYVTRHKTSFSVKTDTDKETCYILGMCQLPDGSIIVADFKNSRLKQFDNSFKVIRHCSLASEPCDVCHIAGDQVAVGLLGNTIQIFIISETMARPISFPTGHNCNSLAYSNRCLYVTELYGTNVYVYNLYGKLLRKISRDLHGRQLFSSIHRITISPDGARLHIADEKGLVTLDMKGTPVATFTSPELVDGPYAVCVDRAGNVFVGGCSSNNILQVGGRGDKKVAEILSHSDGRDVRALCFDNVNCRLLVSSRDSDTVQAL